MRLKETLLIGGKQFRVVSRSISLVLSGTGRATFKIATETTDRPSGLVLFRSGYANHVIHDFFMGFIVSAHRSGLTWTLECVELVHGLTQKAAISLRQCQISDVANDISAATEVRFVVGTQGGQRPRFASHADGFHAVRAIPGVFGLKNFVFFQKTDGMVWLGSWDDAGAAYTENRQIDPKFFIKYSGSAAVIPALPVLRPGMLVNGKRIESLRLVKHETQIKWKS